MKLLLSVLFLLSFLFLVAQNSEGEAAARVLHEEGISLLENTPARVFNKVEALAKFIQCHKQLKLEGKEGSDLYGQNQTYLHTLLTYFDNYQNGDSLLRSTRFFPDSVFQQNDSYPVTFKSLINNYLRLKERVVKNKFFQIKDLYVPYSSESINNRGPAITFNNYWPLEVIEFEEWLKTLENRLRTNARPAREELLHLHLQSKLDTLQFQMNTTNYLHSQSLLRENLQRIEEENTALRATNRKLKIIGLSILGIILVFGFLFWKKNRQLLEKNNQLLLEAKKRSEDLLSNMLPAEVVRQLKDNRSVKAQRYQAVSVMFSDFKNFSQIAKALTPEELIGELNECFTAFDHIIEKYHLQKIKTIGDAYMCVGGLYTRGHTHVDRMVAAALEMQQFLIGRGPASVKPALRFCEARIGIHTGPVVAGVIGTKKIAFDIWGDTVNVAQQMEQCSEEGKVNISGETFDLIKDKFDCEYRGKAIMKNQKEYDMYFVKGPTVPK